jgi:hypothetical protein
MIQLTFLQDCDYLREIGFQSHSTNTETGTRASDNPKGIDGKRAYACQQQEPTWQLPKDLSPDFRRWSL